MQQESIDTLWSRVVEVYKARMTLALALLVAMVSLTGYALAHGLSVLLLIAAVVPWVALLLDLVIVYRLATPFLYAILARVPPGGVDDATGLLFLDFGHSSRKFTAVMSLEEGAKRQRTFRKLYVRRGLLWRLSFFGVGSAGEAALWLWLRAG
jgi:hypothetical protein